MDIDSIWQGFNVPAFCLRLYEDVVGTVFLVGNMVSCQIKVYIINGKVRQEKRLEATW